LGSALLLRTYSYHHRLVYQQTKMCGSDVARSRRLRIRAIRSLQANRMRRVRRPWGMSFCSERSKAASRQLGRSLPQSKIVPILVLLSACGVAAAQLVTPTPGPSNPELDPRLNRHSQLTTQLHVDARSQQRIYGRWHELATGGNHSLGSSTVILSSYFEEGWQVE
jgi:hypothetical protein